MLLMLHMECFLISPKELGDIQSTALTDRTAARSHFYLVIIGIILTEYSCILRWPFTVTGENSVYGLVTLTGLNL